MLKTDFIHILSDAIQQHEGWSATEGASYPNLNPGNLEFEGQLGAAANGRWAKFDNFYDGKQGLNNDISAKLKKLSTIRDVITVYAPPNENDTEAYIAAVCAFFLSRNVVVNADTPIDTLLSTCQTPMVVIVINQLFQPADWAQIQATIVDCAKYMPAYAFSTRYSNVDFSKDIVESQGNPTQTPWAVISGSATNKAIAPYNNGQVLNVLLYNGSVLVGNGQAAGGCEWQGQTLNGDPVSAYASVVYEGPTFTDFDSRAIFHELIHELFSVTGQTDILHQYLMEHGGYMANLLTDLEAVFTGNQLNTPAAVQKLQAAEKVEQQAVSNP